MHKSLPCPGSLFIQDWENAGASLAAAISRFFELSTRLESQCTITDATSSSLIARIDSTLSFFQTTLDSQLTGARVALAKTRNRLICASSILKLPEEVLTHIFLYFVYDPLEVSPTSRSVDFDIQLIYKRVHVLLGVCTSWRNAAISCGSLWCLVPMVDPSIGRPGGVSTELSVQRAGNRPLHLAIYKPQYRCPKSQVLSPCLSQVETINMCLDWAESHGADDLLYQLFKKKTRSLVKLSLRHEAMTPLPAKSHSNPFTAFRSRMLALIKSLSVLRISNITVAWKGISFSHNLTEFWLGDVVLGRVALLGLLSALKSASELRHLTIVSTEAIIDDQNILPSTITLPKLMMMHLERLPYNFLDLLLTVITPGSYWLTLNPRSHIGTNYPSEEFVDSRDICNLFRKRPIQEIILVGEEQDLWDRGLLTVLESVPALKVLTLIYYIIDSDVLEAFIPSQGHSAFPKLETLELYGSIFSVPFDDLQEDFVRILEHHPIQRMVIGGVVSLEKDATRGLSEETPLDQDSDTIRWLKTRVPQFHFSGDLKNSPAIVEDWQLWDV